MKLKNKANKGITLVALVITIIILLILVGVTIVQLTSNGLLTKAQQAAKESKYANAAEKVALAVNASYDTTGSLNDDYLKDNLNRIDGINEPVEKVEYDLKVVVDGFEFTISKYGKIIGEKTEVATLPNNTTDTKAGTEVKMPEKWGTQTISYIDTTDGTEVTTLETVSTVYAISVGNGETIPVPKGFVYVGGNIETGAVISDNPKDKDKYLEFTNTDEVPTGIPAGVAYKEDGTIDEENSELKGNQFVWIPCTINEYKKTNWGKQKNNSWDANTNQAEIAYIEKYGGFYIGRYEAGTSKLTSSKIEFGKVKGGSGYDNKNFSAEYITDGTITCKAGEIPYYHADYETAQKMTQTMYATDPERKNSVHSALPTGTMWDVILNYFEAQDSTLDVKTNTTWGNYSTTTLTNCKGRYIEANKDSGATSIAIPNTDGKRHNGIMTCGSTEDVKKNNIYDMAGNLWEWTEELGEDVSTNYHIYHGR